MFPDTQKVTRDESKVHNRRLALKLIYAQEAISRADIARATGLTRTTASAAVTDLIEAGLVEEMGQGPSGGGKPPTLVQLVPDARHIIAIDLSGTVFRGAVVDLRGNIVACATSQPAEGSDPHNLGPVWMLIDSLLAATDRPVLGIGVGLPGLLDTVNGVVLQAVNRRWRNLPLKDLMSQRYSVPICLANDSQAAALSEVTFDNPSGVRDLAVILIDQGISAGIVIDGRVYQGSNHLGASEIGHIRVVEGGELCACGHFGCLETVAGRAALLRRAETIYANQPGSLLRKLVRTADEIDLALIVQAYKEGDRAAAKLIAQVSRYLSIAVANLVCTLNISHIVLAGSVPELGEALLEPLSAELRERVLPELAERTALKISTQAAGLVRRGAAALVIAQELGAI
ncbi:MAG: ROK family protein [Nitrososphaerales archaeon]